MQVKNIKCQIKSFNIDKSTRFVPTFFRAGTTHKHWQKVPGIVLHLIFLAGM